MSSMTHHNPFGQGGWERELAASYSPTISSGSGFSSPAPSTSSSNSSASSASGFVPPQSSYGALPTSTPGAAPQSQHPGISEYYEFRFESAQSGTELSVKLGATEHFRIRPGRPVAVVHDGRQLPVAKIGWQPTGAIVESNGVQKKSTEVIRPMPGNPNRKLTTINGIEHVISFDGRAYYIHASGMQMPICIVRWSRNGIEFLLHKRRSSEMLLTVVLVIMLLQSGTFGGAGA